MVTRYVRPAIVEDACDRCAIAVTSTCIPDATPSPLERLPEGWALVGSYNNPPPGPSEWLMCPACMHELLQFMKAADNSGPDPRDDDGPESVPEGAEGTGPGWSVRNAHDDDLCVCGHARESHDRTTADGAHIDACDVYEYDGMKTTTCDCDHFRWRAAARGRRFDVCVCGHLRALHVLDDATPGVASLAKALGSVCTCSLDGGVHCDCKAFRSERAADRCTRCQHPLQSHETPGSECTEVVGTDDNGEHFCPCSSFQ